MSIAIDQNACIGCGKCHDVCPGTLIHLNTPRIVGDVRLA